MKNVHDNLIPLNDSEDGASSPPTAQGDVVAAELAKRVLTGCRVGARQRLG